MLGKIKGEIGTQGSGLNIHQEGDEVEMRCQVYTID